MAKQEAYEKAKAEFLTFLNALEMPIPPDGTINVFNAYVPEFRSLTKAEKAEILKSNPKIEAEKLDNRQVTTGNMIWTGWEINKALSMSKSVKADSTRKLSITVREIMDDDTVKLIGHFRTAKEACTYLGLDNGKSSARYYLADVKGYNVKPYDGTDFTVKETA